VIYFAQPVGGGPVKIGYAVDVDQRIRQLAAHYNQTLNLIAKIEGGPKVERSIHRKFAHLRFGHTEQFRPAQELMDFIGKPILVSENPELVEPLRPGSSGLRHTVIHLKGSPEFVDWLEGASKQTHFQKSIITRIGYELFAEKYGLPKPPIA
jgi:hypothetical protein